MDADLSSDSDAVLCALDRLWRRADFHPGMVAVHALQRALRIAVAAGIRRGRRDSGRRDCAIETIAKDVAACGASRIAPIRGCELRIHLEGWSGLLQRSIDQHER